MSATPGRSGYSKMLGVLLIGCAINYMCDRLLGVQIELFRGLDTFSIAWVLDMFAVPFAVGWIVGILYGVGGKWLCYFPPFIVRLINYAVIAYSGAHLPQGASLIPLGWWGLFVILNVEAAAFGGILGESMVKSNYGRRPSEQVYKPQPSGEEEEG